MFERFKKRHESEATEVWDGRKRTHKRSLESQQMVLDYLKEHEGEVINYEAVADELGFTGGYVSILIKNLMASKAVTRKGNRGHYTFTTRRAKAKRRAYNTRKSVPVKAAASKPAVELRKSSSSLGSVKGKREEAVLNYLKKHQREFLSQDEISRGSGISQTAVSFAVRALEEGGLISRSLPVPNLGTQYIVNDARQAEAKVDPTPQHAPKAPVMTYEERLVRGFLEYWKERKV